MKNKVKRMCKDLCLWNETETRLYEIPIFRWNNTKYKRCFPIVFQLTVKKKM